MANSTGVAIDINDVKSIVLCFDIQSHQLKVLGGGALCRRM